MPASETACSPLVRLPARVRGALRPFRNLTGLTAVTSLAPAPPAAGDTAPLPPAVHPRCARQLRALESRPPCREQWLAHLRSGGRSPAIHSHTCPIGLRCACVPIRFEGNLVGIVKLVAGPETPGRTFTAATRLLDLVVAGVCQESAVGRLSEEVRVLRDRVATLQQVQRNVPPGRAACPPEDTAGGPPGNAQHASLVANALAHLHQHYQSPSLSLVSVAEALGCNPRYLTTRFTSSVGERMHAYLVRLRTGQACRLLIESPRPVKEIAYSSGFRDNTALARAFQRHVGVSPGEYRRIFAAG